MNKSTLKGLAPGPVGKLVVTGNSGNGGSMKGGRVGGWEGGRVGGWVGGWCGAVQVGSNIEPSPVLYYRLELLYFFVLFQGMFGGGGGGGIHTLFPIPVGLIYVGPPL